MDPRERLLGLLSAQNIRKAFTPIRKFVGAPLGVLDAVSEMQPSFMNAAYSRAMIPPQQRFNYRNPDADESYDMIAEVAQNRRAAMMQIAKAIRDTGGSSADVAAAWRDPSIMGRLNQSQPNPGDLLRGAGRITPKAGMIQNPALPKYNNAPMSVTPGYAATNRIPTTGRAQQMLDFLRNQGLIETTNQPNLD